MRERRRGLQLYVKRVFIMDDCEELLPPLPALRARRRRLRRPLAQRLARDPPEGPPDPGHPASPRAQVLAALKEMKEERPEKYRTFWKEFGAVLKEGLHRRRGAAATGSSSCCWPRRRDAPGELTLARRLRRAHEGRPGRDLLPDGARRERGRALAAPRGASGPGATRSCSSPIPSTSCGCGVPREFQGKKLVSVAKGDAAAGLRGGARSRPRRHGRSRRRAARTCSMPCAPGSRTT